MNKDEIDVTSAPLIRVVGQFFNPGFRDGEISTALLNSPYAVTFDAREMEYTDADGEIATK